MTASDYGPLGKIAVATDLSDESEIAVRHGLSLARRYGAELTLIHVGDVPQEQDVPPSLGAVAQDYAEVMKQRFAAARRRLEAERERHAGQGAEVSQVFVDGVPADAIVTTARELASDLLVVGSRGQSSFRRFLLGSTAELVVRGSDTTVLVARNEPPIDGGYRRVLCPVDDLSREPVGLETAKRLCVPGGRIELFHSWRLPGTGGLIAALSDEWADLRAALQVTVENKGEALVSKYGGETFELTFSHREGNPARAIQEALEAGDFDLVVMGSRGRRGISRWALGSVAEMTVRHSKCSVAVVHMEVEAG